MASMLIGSVIFAQTTVTGTVSDADGPLPGANVVVKGTTNGTTTDFDGKYQLDAVPQDGLLVFSFVGYATQEVNVNGQNEISVGMTEDANTLGEVVLTGYTTQNTRDITGSVSVVKEETLQELAPTSVEAALQGIVPGVVVGNEGGPGGASSVRIRGYGTVNDNDPLYIIDGSPSQNGLTDLNPADIRSMQVLKDAASASIYGNRAANGVIIISTKGGSYDRGVEVAFDATVGYDFISSNQYPTLANPQQQAEIDWARQINDGVAPTHPQYGSGAVPILPDYITPAGYTGADIPLDQYSSSNRLQKANKSGTDWFGEFFQPGLVQNYNMGIQGGDEKSKFYIGTGALVQEGTILYTSFNRYNLRANSEFKVGGRVRFGENFNVSYSEQREVQQNQSVEGGAGFLYRIQPIIPVYDESGYWGGTQSSGLGNGQNPVADQWRAKDNIQTEMRILGNVYAEVDIIEGLVFRTNMGLDYATGQFPQYFFVNSNDGEPVSSNSFSEQTFIFRSATWANTFNYETTFGKSSISALLGSEFQSRDFRQWGAGRTQYLIESVDYRYLDRGEQSITNQGSGAKDSYFSIFAKVDYSFDDRYLVSLTYRRDQTSAFTEENRTGHFPAASVGWRISSESFMDNAEIISDLKLKAGYGELGNASIPGGRTSSTFGSDLSFSNYAISGGNNSATAGYNQLTLGNPNLVWETSKTLNIGFDAAFQNNRWFIAFDWYDKTTEGMLLQQSGLDPTVFGNVGAPYANAGDMKNTGFDLELGFSDNLSDDILMTVTANVSQYKNEVISLGEAGAPIPGNSARDQRPTLTAEGQPISSFFGYTFDGIFQTQAEVDAHATQDGAAVGRFIVRDVSGDGKIDAEDRGFIGSPHPDFTWGLNFRLEFRNWDFAFLFTGTQGNEVYNFTKWFTDFVAFPGAKSIDYWDSWRPDNTGAKLPQLTNAAPAHEDEASNYYVEDGSYARLKNLTIGYNFLDLKGINNLKLFLQFKNIFTITNYSGLDPEINLQNYDGDTANQDIGVDRGAYPQAKSVMLGLRLNL